MQINKVNNNIQNTYSNVNKTKEAEVTKPTEKGNDSVALTEGAKALQQVEESIKNSPDVDQKRIDELRELIQSGKYQVDPERVATKLIEMEKGL